MAAALSITTLIAEGCDDRNRVELGLQTGASHELSVTRLRVQLSRQELADAVPSLAPTPSLSPVPSPAPEQTAQATEVPADPAVLLPVALTDVEQAICAAGWPDCAKALRVARCESGPDYLAPWNGYHIGTYQIAPLHALRFVAYGWDYFIDGDNPARNAVVAYEIWQEQGWAPWPVCGYR